MKSTVNRILLLGAALFCVSQTAEAADKSPLTFPDGVSAIRVSDESRPLSNAPAVDPVCAGSINEAKPRYFDLLCTGRCDLIDRVLNLTMTPADKVPSFVKGGTVLDGDAVKNIIVYAEPAPMGTIEVPAGRNGWVKVELKDQRGAFESYKDHILLQVRKQGSDQSVNLYNAGESNNHTVEYIEAEEGDVVELVPILSAAAIGTGGTHTPVTPNNEVDLTAFGGGESLQEFNFTSVYRVDVDFVQRDTSGVARWMEKVELGQGRDEIYSVNNSYHSHGDWTFGVGPTNDTDGESVIFAGRYTYNAGHYEGFYSFDGVNWSYYSGSILSSGMSSGCLLIYGGDRWCALTVNTFSTYEVTAGFERTVNVNVDFSATALAYSNAMFMAVSENGIYTLKDGSNDWQGPIAGSPSASKAFLCYGNDRWILGKSDEGSVSGYFSIDNGESWKTLDDSLKAVSAGGNISSSCSYAQGEFYSVVNGSGYLIKSTDGNNWTKVGKVEGLNCEVNVIHYQNRLYLINLDDGNRKEFITVGLFDPADEGPEAATTNP